MHWNEKYVCELSINGRDFHDHEDSEDNDLGPVHFYEYTCRRCGKKYYI